MKQFIINLFKRKNNIQVGYKFRYKVESLVPAEMLYNSTECNGAVMLKKVFGEDKAFESGSWARYSGHICTKNGYFVVKTDVDMMEVRVGDVVKGYISEYF